MTDDGRPVLAVIGAGTAGLEALLGAHERLGDAVDLRLLAPDEEFRYRPISDASLFTPAAERGLPISELVDETGATWVRQRVAAVHESEREVVTRDGDIVAFDFLLIAAGGRGRRTLSQGHVWERGGNPAYLDATIAGISRRDIRRVAVVVPPGARWAIPGYELALVMAWKAAGTGAEIHLITAAVQPLAALGQEASRLVTTELEDAGVRIRCATRVQDDIRDDRPGVCTVLLHPAGPDAEDAPGHRATFDRLISLPTMIGPALAGVAADANGFVEVDETLRVVGAGGVWAAGGCVAAALQHSALGARQADAAVEQMAARITGGGPNGLSAMPEIAGMLMTGQRERWLAENPGSQGLSTRCLWWPPGRAVGRMLAQRIAAWDPSIRDRLPEPPEGLVVSAPVAIGPTHGPIATDGEEPSEAVRSARLHDIENRQLMAVRRRERAADAELRALNDRLATLTAHQRAVVQDLEHHGYLTGPTRS